MSKSKSASAFRTIGEVANELNVSPHVLRFWESKFKQIRPHKRRGGHRYYRQMDIETIKEVKSLLYDRGFTIKGAQNYLKEQQKTAPVSSQTSLFDAVDPAPTPKTAPADSNLPHIISELHSIKTLLDSPL